MTFTFKNGRYALLTYAQCGELDPWTVSNHLSALGAECIVGRESHADDGIHLHVFVDFGRKFSSRKTDIFDVGGCHPNIERVGKTPWKAYDYAIKDGDVCAGGAVRPDEQSGESNRSADLTWSRILQAETAEEFHLLCSELAPEHYVRSFGSIRSYVEWRYRPVAEPYRTPDGITFSIEGVEELSQWLSQAQLGSGPSSVRRKSLILYGESQLGKTLWARSLGSHLYFGGIYSGEEAMRMDEAEYAIFDDIAGGIKFFHMFKQWFGCQWEISVKRLYRDPKLMVWGKPSIWLANTNPLLEMAPEDANWMESNCIFVDLREKIYFSCQ